MTTGSRARCVAVLVALAALAACGPISQPTPLKLHSSMVATAPVSQSAPAFEPTQLVIPRLSVQAPIEDKGVDSENRMEAPDKPFDVAWYPFTSKAGAGNAVFAGHLDSVSGPAVFWHLGDLKANDPIEVEGSGYTLEYRVSEVHDYPLADFPMAYVLDQSSGDEITLITCAGSYSRGSGYDHRLVVRAHRAS